MHGMALMQSISSPIRKKSSISQVVFYFIFLKESLGKSLCSIVPYAHSLVSEGHFEFTNAT